MIRVHLADIVSDMDYTRTFRLNASGWIVIEDSRGPAFSSGWCKLAEGWAELEQALTEACYCQDNMLVEVVAQQEAETQP